MISINRIEGECNHEAWGIAVLDLVNGTRIFGPFANAESADTFAQAVFDEGHYVQRVPIECPACFLTESDEEEESDDAIPGE